MVHFLFQELYGLVVLLHVILSDSIEEVRLTLITMFFLCLKNVTLLVTPQPTSP